VEVIEPKVVKEALFELCLPRVPMVWEWLLWTPPLISVITIAYLSCTESVVQNSKCTRIQTGGYDIGGDET
jgi:hypothetical protein